MDDSADSRPHPTPGGPRPEPGLAGSYADALAPAVLAALDSLFGPASIRQLLREVRLRTPATYQQVKRTTSALTEAGVLTREKVGTAHHYRRTC